MTTNQHSMNNNSYIPYKRYYAKFHSNPLFDRSRRKSQPVFTTWNGVCYITTDNQ